MNTRTKALLRKSAAALVAVALLATPIASLFFDWRVADGRHVIVACILFAFGALISLTNFYLSFLRYAWLRLRGRSREYVKRVSGIPLFGMLVLPGLLLAPASLGLSLASIVLVMADTGNLIWFVVAVWRDQSFWRGES